MSVHLQFKANGRPILRGQAFMWSVVRQFGIGGLFTANDVENSCNHRHEGSAQDFIRRLVAADIAAFDHHRPHYRGGCPQKVYRLKKAPRTLPPINRTGEAPRQHVGQQFMWNQLRIGGTWTARDLAKFSSTDEHQIEVSSAQTYLHHLNRAGYLITVEKGKGPKPARYRLDPAKNTGVTAPMVLRSKVVFDPNKGDLPGPIEAEVER
ncbi:MAG: hypothetical protein AAGH43_06015 [Pseudomonadota bacterium]